MTDDLLEENTFKIPEGYAPLNWTQGFGRQIGPLYERRGEGTNYTRAFMVSDHHVNGMNHCHGGMLMTFADLAFGHVVSLDVDHHWATVRLLTDFLSGAKLGEWVEGNGVITGGEDDLYTVEGRMWVGDRTVMTGTGVFKILSERR